MKQQMLLTISSKHLRLGWCPGLLMGDIPSRLVFALAGVL